MLPFLGSIPFIVLAVVLVWRGYGRNALPWIIAGLVVYLVAFVITSAVNVPLNNQLDNAGNPAHSDLTAIRHSFEHKWVTWNIVRALVHAAAFGCLAWALVLYGAHRGQAHPAGKPSRGAPQQPAPQRLFPRQERRPPICSREPRKLRMGELRRATAPAGYSPSAWVGLRQATTRGEWAGARRREVAARGWRRWASLVAIAWALGYGSLRIYWALGAAPSSPPIGTDLVAVTGWWPVALCGAAAVVVVAGLRTARWRRPLAVAAWGVTAALAAASALLLLDVVGILLPGVGLAVHPVAFLRRAACLAGGVLVGATTLSYQRHWRGACPACGRPGEAGRPAPPPRWAWLAAWAAVAGCLVRVLAQGAVGFGSGPLRAGGSLLLFEAGFVLAGTVLPLALVYRWGQVFPGWVPLLAGRGVPRWLVLGPALGLAVGMTAYFGVAAVQLAVQGVDRHLGAGRRAASVVVFWVAIPAYLVWGLGLGAAALAYRRATRPPCRTCGR